MVGGGEELARSKEDRRVKYTKYFLVDHSTGDSFRWLSPDMKQEVWDKFMEWDKIASQRGAADTPFPNDQGLNKQGSTCLKNLCKAAQEGFYAYWDRYSHPANDVQPTDDQRTTDEQPIEGEKEGKDGYNGFEGKEGKESAIPTLDEVKQYVREKGYTFPAGKFYAYYQLKGWKADWKAQADYWQETEKPKKDAVNPFAEAVQRGDFDE